MLALSVSLSLALVEETVLRAPLERTVEPAGDGTQHWRAGARCVDEKLSLTFLLKHTENQVAALDTALTAVSDPKSSRYGQFLKISEITAITSRPEAVRRVTAWLTEEGLTPAVGVNEDAVSVDDVPCDVAERLFTTKIHHYHNSEFAGTLLRARTRMTLPAHLAEDVVTVAPLQRLPSVRTPQIVATDDDDAPAAGWKTGCSHGSREVCKNMVTPTILANRYGLPPAPTGAAHGSMAVAEFQGVYWDQKGLDTFSANCKVPNVTVAKSIGPDRPFICRVPLIGTELCMEAMCVE